MSQRSKYGEWLAIIPIAHQAPVATSPLARCSICTRPVEFETLTKSHAGEFVCEKCARPSRSTAEIPAARETEKMGRRTMDRIWERFLASVEQV